MAFDGISGLEVARARYSDTKESHLPFQMNDPDHYRLPTKVLTALGGRTPGHFGRQKKGCPSSRRAERGEENLHDPGIATRQ